MILIPVRVVVSSWRVAIRQDWEQIRREADRS